MLKFPAHNNYPNNPALDLKTRRIAHCTLRVLIVLRQDLMMRETHVDWLVLKTRSTFAVTEFLLKCHKNESE